MNSQSWKVILVSTAEYGPCPTLVRAVTLTGYVVSEVNSRGKEYKIIQEHTMYVNIGTSIQVCILCIISISLLSCVSAYLIVV